ncbi:MAG: metal-dependent hydrolase [Terracidiphilus sp.]
MEPVTHFLTGACMGRAGFNRKTSYAVLAAALAAEAADLDVLWGFAGPVEELKHHRGITHTIWAVPVVAGVVVGVVWLLDHWRKNRQRKVNGPSSLSSSAADEKGGHAQQPIHWGWLYLTAFIAALSHLLLDWTNNYGVRPFFPFNPHWYAGSFMFIAEPVIWVLLFLAFFMPWVLGLADHEIGARKQQFRGRGWAIFALCGMLILGCWRWAEHAQALAMVNSSPISTEPALRIAAEPYPINPFRWHAIVETGDFYQTAEIDTRTSAIESDPHSDILYKPADTAAIEAAKQTELGRAYLDWGTWAVVRDLGPVPAPGLTPPQLPPTRTWTTVEFSDLRFDYSRLAARANAGRPPLAGWVYIVDGHEDAGEDLNGREQR